MEKETGMGMETGKGRDENGDREGDDDGCGAGAVFQGPL